MPKLNSKLIVDIYTNQFVGTQLSLSGDPDYGDLSRAPDLFWINFCQAFFKNTTIQELILVNQSSAVTQQVSQILIQNNNNNYAHFTWYNKIPQALKNYWIF